ncbi:PAS domain S-box protein [Ancylobacter rudongensis]|uniref:PAS domain S-box-containing protein n=1 Tax=Ancylobacter rudongensis TaxID=177413 RepID=A0A1G4RLV0_9HYPH|nr:PAS domain S-box-containing protein [Ancylobacter rudongensis]
MTENGAKTDSHERALGKAVRPFAIESRRKESEVITSFVLRPLDKEPPAPHVAGQHLTLFADIGAAGRQKRNYTISSAPNGETYRISVKREPEGRVSTWLHDEAVVGTILDIAPPAGAFVLPTGDERPLVLLSAGVGLTPMVAMLEALAAANRRLPLQFVHCTQSNATHAFREPVRALAAAVGAETTFFHTRAGKEEVAGRDFDIAGHLTLDWLQTHSPIAEADYFLCGPRAFLRSFVPGLATSGVPAERLHYEFFGAVEDLFDESASAPPSAPPTAPTVAARRSRAGAGIARQAIGDALIDSPADAVVASDAEGAITLWNPGAERIFGFTEQEALGSSLDIIIPEPFRARHWEGYRETVASGQSRYGAGDMLSVPGLTRDGRRISLEFTIALLKDEAGKVTGMVAVLRDITPRFEEMKALKKKVAELQRPSEG